MVWDEHGIQVPFGEKIIGFRLKERGQISSCVPLWEQRNSFEDNEIPDAALSRPCAGLSGPKIAGVTGKAVLAFMTISSHSEVMKSAKISELKAKLSSYLAEVRSGGTVVVYDRTKPIAQIVPFRGDQDDLVIIEASAPPAELKKMKGVRPKKPVDVDKLLADLRKDR